jgi:formylglycine-generating enzyme required for sulfatase activity
MAESYHMGSYLCASNYCARYHPAARQPQEVDLSAPHLGFRTVGLTVPITLLGRADEVIE